MRRQTVTALSVVCHVAPEVQGAGAASGDHRGATRGGMICTGNREASSFAGSLWGATQQKLLLLFIYFLRGEDK